MDLTNDRASARYLLYSASREGNTTIWLQRLTAGGTEMIGERRPLIQADRPDENHIVEAPTIICHGGTYVLFYSGNAYDSDHYFVNYATAGALCDEFVKQEGLLLNQRTLKDAYQNPGGQDVLHTHHRDFWSSTPTPALPAAPCSWRC